MSDEMKWGQNSQEPEQRESGAADNGQQNNASQNFDNNHNIEKPASHPYSAARYQNTDSSQNTGYGADRTAGGSQNTGYNTDQTAGSSQNTGYNTDQTAGSSQNAGYNTDRTAGGSQNTGYNTDQTAGSAPNQGAAAEGRSNTQVPPKYAHYQMHQGRPDGQTPPSGGRNSGKRKSGFGKKVGTTVALAAVFGLVAGTVFQGVNYVSREYLGLGGGRTASVESTQVLDQETDGAGKDLSEVVAKNGTVAGVAKAAMPSVVAITSVSVQELPDLDLFSFFYGGGGGTRQYQSAGSGSGIIVGENDDELLIATNNHVVEGATTLSVCFIGDDVVNAEQETQNLAGGGDINVEDAVTAKIKGTDPDNDLAVVSVNKKDIPEDTMNEIKIAQIGNSDSLVVGEQVVAIGNALGYGQSVTSGWVSALDRTVTMENGISAELIQTDAAINPGNSGGALLNMRGELIGINSSKYASDAVEGMGYAIPISKAQPILESLMNRKTRERVEDASQSGYLGVTVAKDLSIEAIEMYNIPIGAFVVDVEENGSAAKVGIQKNDIIVKLDGQKVSGRADLIEKLQFYEAGEEVEIIYARSNNGEYEEHTVTAVLGARPENSK